MMSYYLSYILCSFCSFNIQQLKSPILFARGIESFGNTNFFADFFATCTVEITQYALKGQKLLAQGIALGNYGHKLVAL